MGKNLYSKLGFLFLSLVVPLASCNTPISNTNVLNSDIKNDPFSKVKNSVSNLSTGKGFRVKSTTASIPLGCYTLADSNYFYNVPNSSISDTSFGFVLRDPPPAPERNIYYVSSYSGSSFRYAIYSESKVSLYIGNGWSGIGFEINNGIFTGGAGNLTGGIGFTATGNVSMSNGVLNITASNPQTSDGSGRESVWSSSFNASIPMSLIYNYKYIPECDPWSIELSGASSLIVLDNKPVDVTVTPSEPDRYWVLTVTGAGGYSMSYRDIGGKTISIPDGVALPNSTTTYKAEVHYEERSGTKATATFVFVPPSDPPSPTPDPTVTPTSTPTAVPTPTPTPTETPVCPDGSIEIPNYKDLTGKPLCCPNIGYAICGVFSDPSSNPSSNPSGNPSAGPSSNPSSNPTANPSVNPSSNPSSNPTSTPSGSGSGTDKKRGVVRIEAGKRIVSTVVATNFRILVTSIGKEDAWTLKMGNLDIATGIGPQILDINSSDLNRGLPAETYLEDGYYDLYLDINPEAKDLLGVDNTPPKISVDETKSTVSDNGDVNLTLKIEDPMVNGVSSGVDSTALPKSILGSDGSSVSLAYTADTSTANQDMQAYFPSGFGVASLKTPKKSISVTSKIHVNKKKGFKLKSVEDSLEEARVTFILGLSNSETKIADKVKNTDYCYVGK